MAHHYDDAPRADEFPRGTHWSFDIGGSLHLVNTPDLRFSAEFLRTRLLSDPSASDAGTVYIGTIYDAPDGSKVRGAYYLDEHGILLDAQREDPEHAGEPLGFVMTPQQLTDPTHDIVIGRPFKLPDGTISPGAVASIGMPFQTPARGSEHGNKSPAYAGKVNEQQYLRNHPDVAAQLGLSV